MTILGFYFSNTEKWIEYELNGETIKQYFETDESIRSFISDNNLPLTYKGCVNCD